MTMVCAMFTSGRPVSRRMLTDRQSTALAHAKILAESTLMAYAITTLADVRIVTIQLMVSAIVGLSDTLIQRVDTSADITPHQLVGEHVTLTASTVPDSLLMDGIAT